ncbi:transposase [Neoasaia chiangmaiensis NBRC 101099]|nr:transposase [Neoasaia chiangmaiensis NBRC 101099]GEN13937.1 hypothetical protein NCH01_03680 [Neoasaia chiangmaiensis]
MGRGHSDLCLSRRSPKIGLHHQCHRGAERQAEAGRPGQGGGGHFPNANAALKLLFLALNRAEKEWIMPPKEWSMAKAQFAILFGDRFARVTA